MLRSARLWWTCLGLAACGGGGSGGTAPADGAVGGALGDEGVAPDGAAGGTAGGATPSDASPGGEVVPDGTTGGATGGQPATDAGPTGRTCGEACALLDECGSSLPTGCLNTCEGGAPAERAAFGRCAERLAEGACALDAFFECLVEEVFPECARACEASTTCDLALEDACGRACVLARLGDDPLASLRFAQRDACLSAAGEDCAAAGRCAAGAVAEVPDLGAWCAAYQQCGFDAQFDFPCGDAYNILAGTPAPGGLACAWALLGAGVCPPDPYFVFEQCARPDAPPAPGVCTAVCEAIEACDPDQAPAASVEDCTADCEGQGDTNVGARVRALLPCAAAGDCGAFDACVVEQGPATQCAQLCGRRAACLPNEDADVCDTACLEAFGSVRTQRSLACARDNPTCDDFTACLPAPTPPCDAYCASLATCGLELGDPAFCVQMCDQESLDSQGYTDARVACTLSAGLACAGPPNTLNVDACIQAGWAPGQGCLLACRAQTVCAGAPADALWPCVEACADGTAGAEAQANALVVEACVAGIEPFGPVSCDVLARCAPSPEGADCEGYCAQVEACGVAPPDCAASCAADPLARSRALREGACLAAAGNDCAAVRACRAYAPAEAVQVDREAVCARWAACGLDDFFPCQFALNVVGDDRALLACIDAQIGDACPPNPRIVVDACISGRSQVDAVCLTNCAARGVCGLEGGGAGCVSACVDRANLPDPSPDDAARAAPQRACLDEGVCADLAACIASNTPAALCEAHCAALEACGAVQPADAAACRSACDDRFARPRSQAERACVATAGGACDAVRACLSTPPACEAACARIAGCGFEQVPFDCVAACDDAAFAAGERGARIPTCVLTTPVCSAEAEACFAGATDAAELCARFCDVSGGCGAGQADWTACMNACGAPLETEAALRLDAGARCLLDAGEGDCAAQAACLPARADTPTPEALCPRATACGVPAADCEAAVSGVDGRAAAVCLVEAARLSAGCGAIAACVGFVPPPPAPGCDVLCARRTACDPSVDAFLCAQTCSSEPAAAQVRAACAEVSRCDAVEACAALDAQTAPLCVAPCADAVACGAFASAEACGAVCTGRLRSPSAPADYLLRLDQCLNALNAPPACDAEAARACFDFPRVGEGCEGACQILVDCGTIEGQSVEECAGECANASAMNPDVNARVIQCIIDFAGGGVCDLGGAQACADAAAGRGEPGGPAPEPPPAQAPR